MLWNTEFQNPGPSVTRDRDTRLSGAVSSRGKDGCVKVPPNNRHWPVRSLWAFAGYEWMKVAFVVKKFEQVCSCQAAHPTSLSRRPSDLTSFPPFFPLTLSPLLSPYFILLPSLFSFPCPLFFVIPLREAHAEASCQPQLPLQSTIRASMSFVYLCVIYVYVHACSSSRPSEHSRVLACCFRL